MATVTFDRASRVYPKSTRPAVNELSLEIGDGELLVLVGPSGCGKTTSLRMLAGLESVDSGAISVDGQSVVDLPPRDRDIAMVFQNYALYPHMSVADNIAFGLKVARYSKSEIQARIADAAKMLDLEDYLHRKPAQLSGGQRQRVAMGRAIVRHPSVFLMDEPLSNLDAKLRVSTRSQIAELQRRLGTTTLYVTHDQVEAMTLGDRVATMRDGVLQQCDTPRALYESPANAFVAGFIGSPAMNLLDGRVEEAGVRVGGHLIPIPRGLVMAVREPDGLVTVGLRPESLQLVDDDGIPIKIALVEELGAEAFVYARLSGPENESVTSVSDLVARAEPGSIPTLPGQAAYLRVKDSRRVLLFDRETGERIKERS